MWKREVKGQSSERPMLAGPLGLDECIRTALRPVAATASLFILVNSLAGLGGQLTKLGAEAQILLDAGYLVLPVAVLLGGQVGSRIGATLLPAAPIRRLTGLVVLIVGARLLWQII